MSIINKVLKTRYILGDILNDIDFDTSSISQISEKEIKIMLSKTSDISDIKKLGGSGNCNFIVKHKYLSKFMLNVIYVNIGEESKLTKSLKDKIINLYDEILDDLSSCLLIVNEKISDSLYKTLDELNIELSEKQINMEEIENEMKQKDYFVNRKNFRRCWIVNIDSVTINLKNHSLVSKHTPIKDERKIDEILKKCNCKKFQLPIISRNDIMSQYTLAVPGDIMEIIRTSKTCGTYPFYRLVK